MTREEIVKALRCTSASGGPIGDCADLGQIMLAKLTLGREDGNGLRTNRD